MNDKPLDPEKVLSLAAADLQRDSEDTSVPTPTVAELAASFPDYKIRGLIGRGGMGAVFRALHVHLDREIALKVLPKALAQDPTFEERFIREARALALLDHPNILRVHDFGEADGWFYLVTEYVDGVNLRQMMEMGRPTPQEALQLVPQICDALHFAHDHGVVHRDIKPENILVDQAGVVKIADFGIAKLRDDPGGGVNLTQTRQVLGTPHYMAPEQIEQPTLVDHRADIFSLGVVLYEMLTGRLPLGRFGPPSDHSDASPLLDPVIMRSLERDPDRRYQTAEDLKSAVADDRSIPARDSKARRTRERRRRRQAARDSLPLFGAALLGAGVLSGIMMFLSADVTWSYVCMSLLAAASIVGFRALSSTPHGAENRRRRSIAMVCALLPLLLVANVFIAFVLESVLPDLDESDGVWVWGSSLLADLSVLVWLLRRAPSSPNR